MRIRFIKQESSIVLELHIDNKTIVLKNDTLFIRDNHAHIKIKDSTIKDLKTTQVCTLEDVDSKRIHDFEITYTKSPYIEVYEILKRGE